MSRIIFLEDVPAVTAPRGTDTVRVELPTGETLEMSDETLVGLWTAAVSAIQERDARDVAAFAMARAAVFTGSMS